MYTYQDLQNKKITPNRYYSQFINIDIMDLVGMYFSSTGIKNNYYYSSDWTNCARKTWTYSWLRAEFEKANDHWTIEKAVEVLKIAATQLLVVDGERE